MYPGRGGSRRAVGAAPHLPFLALSPASIATIGSARVAVAVSGGPDSMALLHLAAHALPGRVHALTVDHRLRPEGAAEAAMAGAVCARLRVPHATLIWHGRKPRTGRPAAARTARYRLMRRWCTAHAIPFLMTAHHADDQAETLLMRLARASGPRGLGGIRAARPLGSGVTLLRPLLHARKADLIAYCAAHALPTASDPTNADPAYARTAARALLAATAWLDVEALAGSAAHLADAHDTLGWASERAWAGRAILAADRTEVDADDLPRALRLALLARGIASVVPHRAIPRGPDLARLLGLLDDGYPATLGGAHVKPGPPWRFAAEGPRGG